ncbi:MAG: single-stranded-DNA-specific exonuclease RecJ [Ardenticatenaceae bacterium]|nr:single-stranded-DNA-specific exonuclease RecJ [Ardenticatenaceae bacterium]MCB8947176.1 single-stranded-DNA-specific exonuclease RecJ [Ardenticatenaceae bacterium]
MNRPTTLRKNIWQVAPRVPDHIQEKFSHIHPVMLQVLYNRGIINPGDIQAFLEGHYLESTDPFLLPDMDKAVARIEQAIDNEEMIIVYGDFDADGVTSTVLLTQALRGLGADRNLVRPYIPDRVDEGYGLNVEALTELKEKGANLVITVDCGIRSVFEVEHANQIGLEMIITDHHSLGPKMPPGTAVINPKRPDSEYPDDMLAGVGIAFKLAQALKQSRPDRATFDEADLLDLVAIGTVADLAPLLKENRKLVIDGLKSLNNSKRAGIAALARAARLTPGSLTAESIAFGIGPRINAAGRLAHAYSAAKLLAANNSLDANRFADELDRLNRQRQKLTAELSELAEGMVEPDAPILIAADEKFVSGVVGLVASRLAEKHYRPAIVMEQGEEESRGSCRSIDQFHITDALDEVADLLVRHGGHAQAAGFTVRNTNLPEFLSRITAVAERKLQDVELVPTLSIDTEIALEDVDWALFEHLQQLEPTGAANPQPVFLSRGVEVVHHRAVGQSGAHLQLTLSADSLNGYREIGAIAFRQGEWASHLPQTIDLVYSISVNEWRGNRNLQLMVQDIRPSQF